MSDCKLPLYSGVLPSTLPPSQRVEACNNWMEWFTTSAITGFNEVSPSICKAVEISDTILDMAKYKGDYVVGLVYMLGESVTLGDNVYISKEDNNADIPPSAKWYRKEVSKSGLKNLWINGGFKIWDYGESGEYTSNQDARYGTNRTLFESHTYTDANGDTKGTGGTYLWQRVDESDRTCLQMTHTNATGLCSIGQRWERDILLMVGGKTVTFSIEYKTTINMKGLIAFHQEQREVHESIEQNTNEEIFDIIGDDQWHRVTFTATIPPNPTSVDPQAYFGATFDYGVDDGSGGIGAVPDCTMRFSKIQLEINDKATDFSDYEYAIERMRCNRYHQVKETKIYETSPASNAMISECVNIGDMRVIPAVVVDNISQSNISTTYPPTDINITKENYTYRVIADNAGVTDYHAKLIFDAEVY